jgi:putative addiction module killer protein
MNDEIQIKIYRTESGEAPYISWIESLDSTIEARVNSRISRIKTGNFGDCIVIKGIRGLYELRIHFGAGYRIYFGKTKNTIVLLLCGGSKRTQKRDIEKAKNLWEEYKKWLKTKKEK